MEVTRRSPSLMILDDVLSDDDLDVIGRTSASVTFKDQDLGSGHLRHRQRADLDNSALARRIWTRIGSTLPEPKLWYDDERQAPDLDPSVDSWSWVGLNPRMRFYRYALGAEFAVHVDEPWWPDQSSRTLLTVLAYLPCGGCEGGETVVGDETVAAVDVRVAIFDHRVPHSGRPVERGAKLVLRSDVIAGVNL